MKNRLIRMLGALFLLLAFIPLCANAVDEPKPGKTDSRMRKVRYNPDDVVRLIGYVGYTITVFFEQGETIEPIVSESGKSIDPVILGNPEAWSALWVENTLTLKPSIKKGEKASTSLTVKTNRRRYVFELILGSNDGITDTPNAKGMMFQVSFLYGEEPKTAPIGSDAPQARNYRYSAQGSQEDAPYQVWDNGYETSMRFYQQQEIPSVFIVDASGNESMVAKHMEVGKTLVIHGVFKQLRLRYGNRVLCIIKEDPLDRSPPLTTGTISPSLVRERK